ncbi:MAG TPA: 1,2-phenylacetyl-CoA epoxidase subunit PaaC [Gemmatimonadaceae bacterium]|jgi:ring-1,2-phenylacetyl-CoA epoxidase subunit PaaC|nr:1,2-phenylacetyl-CoA epoxidase subunit PaaC [Gemmatimonadaceae bacterium]
MMTVRAAEPLDVATLAETDRATLAEYLQRLGDDRLVLGHRLSEWCGHAPILEEDIALGNIALDLIGQATRALELAGETEGKGRNADRLAYFREAVEYRNLQLVELPRGDFGYTIARQFFFDAFSVHFLDALRQSSYAELAAWATKALKEDRYHLRHSSEWMLKLGDGTAESHARVQRSVNELWRFTGEMFMDDAVDERMAQLGIVPKPSTLRAQWNTVVTDVLSRAQLERPTHEFFAHGGRTGRHTESLGHMLAEMQIVARSHPDATEW